MARPVKCPYCAEYFDRDSVSYGEQGGRYYHSACLEKKNEEAKEYKSLIHVVCKQRGWSRPTQFVLKQIKDFTEQEGYTHKGIKLTLIYMHSILNQEVPKDDTIGIGSVRYKYNEAQSYFENLISVQKHNKELKEIKKEARIVKSTAKKSKPQKTVNLEEIL